MCVRGFGAPSVHRVAVPAWEVPGVRGVLAAARRPFDWSVTHERSGYSAGWGIRHLGQALRVVAKLSRLMNWDMPKRSVVARYKAGGGRLLAELRRVVEAGRRPVPKLPRLRRRTKEVA